MSGFEIELPSSPDPLGDESIVIPPGSVAPPPPSTTRRPFQSAASSRFSAIPGTSPRKRMFALDVGNEITPQTIYVTVEAGPDGNPITKPGRASVGGPNVRRLLFGSPTPQPSPRRGPRTTTTTVPLRGLTDDEGDPTPRRRRRSSTRPGTPATAGAKRKKKGTPTPKPKGRPRGTPVASSDALQSEAPATIEKPTPGKRGRPRKRKAESAPSDQDGHAPPEASTTKKPGRKRQKSIQADDTDELTTAGIDIAPPQSYDRLSSENIDDTNQHLSLEEAREDGGAAHQEEADEEDPFLAQLSDPPRDTHPSSTAEQAMESFEPLDEGQFEQQHPYVEDEGPLPGEPDDYAPMMDLDDRSDVDSHHDGPPTFNAQAEHESLELEDQGPLPGESDDYAPMMDRDDESDVQSRRSEATPRASRNIRHEPLELEDQGPLPGEPDDYAPMTDVDDRSDTESHHNFRPARSEDATDNTVDPDTFTMIGIETMPSFQGNRGAPTSDLPEIGETTSLLINKTLESLRQEMDATDDENDDVDLLGSREQTPVEAKAGSAHKISSGRKRSPPKSSHMQGLRARQSPRTSTPPRAATSLEHTASESLQENTQPPAQPIREKDNSNVTGVSSDELNADNDSFSDIPEEVFAAVEPQEMPRPARSPSEDELSMAVVPAQNSAPDSAHNQETIPVDSQDNEFADIPQSPPDRLEGSHADDGDFLQRSVSRSAQFWRRSSQSTQKSSPPHPTRSCSDSNRLLTPPDEPTSSSDQSNPATNQPNEEQNVLADGDNEIGSSPPEITTFDREDERPMQDSRRSSDTPTNRPPSIHLQPVQAREANAAIFPSQSAGPRPFLSPIVRVGERLQNILSDPPSPSARSSVLGSPFKGSVRKSSLDAPSDEEAVHRDTSSNTTLQNPPAPPESPKPTWTQSLFSLSHFKSLVTEGTKRITSPQVNVTQTWEDPFGPSSPSKDRGGSGRNSAFMERIRQASREGSVHSSRASVARATLGEVEDRSLSGDPAPRGLSSAWRGERSQKPGLLGSGVIPGQCHVGRLGGSDGAADEGPQATAADRLPEEPRTDDTLLQPVESETAETESIRYPQLHDEVVQEGEIQTQPKEDAMQIDEAARDGDGSDDDIWAIEADRTASSPTAQKRANESINESFNAFARSGLSIDWGTRSTISQNLPPGRSPASKQSLRGGSHVVHENLEDYSLLDLHSGTDTQPSAKKLTPEPQQQPKRVDLSDFFSSSPNFIEREQRARTALKARSMARTSTESHAPQITWPGILHDTQAAQNQAQMQPSSDSRFSDELPTPARATDQPFGQDAMGHLSSESTPERPRLTQQRLAPRPSQNDAALFENWEVSSSRGPTERLHVSDPISDAQPSSPEAIERPSTPGDPEESSFEAPTLKPLPGRTISPSKSCLRSPLKPKTPGRVVEFTSSTLSPMAQGQARTGPQAKSTTTTLGRPPTLSPRRSPRGKENQPSALKSYIHSSPRHRHLGSSQQRLQEEPADSPLSQTKWSKRHWLLLDELLQAYRRNALDFQLRHSDAVMASPKKRASSSLLGKMVTSQGERMALEQWHLDIVDAFRKEVGGWPEDALAKRLFSLIVGEDRRRSGLVPKRR